MISLLKFILNAQFIIGFVLGGATMYIYLHWKKNRK